MKFSEFLEAYDFNLYLPPDTNDQVLDELVAAYQDQIQLDKKLEEVRANLNHLSKT